MGVGEEPSIPAEAINRYYGNKLLNRELGDEA